MITDAGLNLGSNVKKKELIYVLIMLIAFIMTFFLKVNVVLIILFGGLIGTLKVVLHERRNKGGGE